MNPASARVSGFKPFVGQHCETVATGSLLGTAGIHLSEPMLFGLGAGLGFIFIKLSSLPLPFVGGRVRPFALTTSLCDNLGLKCVAVETSSRAKAWASLEHSLLQDQPVGLQLDCYFLKYFSNPIHFAAHFVAAYGFDDQDVLLVDTAQQGSGQRATRKDVEAARFAKGPMAARARSWTIAIPQRTPALDKAVRKAVRANARDYLAPGFKGASHLGIRKLAESLPDWLAIAPDPSADLRLAAQLMEKAGTGGALFRNFFRDFLLEASEFLPAKRDLMRAHQLFADSATEWTAVAALIETAGRTATALPLREAAARCQRIADLEVEAMRLLVTV